MILVFDYRQKDNLDAHQENDISFECLDFPKTCFYMLVLGSVIIIISFYMVIIESAQ